MDSVTVGHGCKWIVDTPLPRPRFNSTINVGFLVYAWSDDEAFLPENVVRFDPKRPDQAAFVPLFRFTDPSPLIKAFAAKGTPVRAIMMTSAAETARLLAGLRDIGATHVFFDPDPQFMRLTPIESAILDIERDGVSGSAAGPETEESSVALVRSAPLLPSDRSSQQ